MNAELFSLSAKQTDLLLEMKRVRRIENDQTFHGLFLHLEKQQMEHLYSRQLPILNRKEPLDNDSRIGSTTTLLRVLR